MNHDLIKQLQSLSPTEGEWHAVDFAGYVNILDAPYYEAKDLFNIEDFPNDYLINGKLASLAPTMRLAILEMAKEIEELRSQLEAERNSVRLITKKVVDNIAQPKIQMVTACGRFETNPMFTSATLCKNCGKEKALHVTPQPK